MQPGNGPRPTRHGFNMRAALLADAKTKLVQIRDEPRFELLTPTEADALLDYIAALEDDHPRKATYRDA